MTLRREEWLTDRRHFLQLVTDRDPTGELPIAIRIDLTPQQVAVMAPGLTDFDEMRAACTRWVQNFLAPEVTRMERVLKDKAAERA